MTAAIAAGRRYLPRGYADFARQLLIWIGFIDTLDQFGGLNHGSGLVQLAANPYAAMPSLHAADALIVGVILASVVRNRIAKAVWLVWPPWVSFAVMATGNHFWLDVVAGMLLGTLALAIVYQAKLRRFIASLL